MRKIIILVLLSFVLISGCEEMPRACTEDAKVCPDGSAVGRIPPDCEFAECPQGECIINSDCVKATCCHASECVTKSRAPNCNEIMCSMECAPGTMDCGQGSCQCIEGNCQAVMTEESY